MELIDNHTHLNDEPFRGKEKYYLDRAEDLGVTKVICAGQDPDFNQRAVDLAQKYDNVYAMVGYCPDVAKDYDQAAEDKLIEQLKLPKVVAMGEIGLDYYWMEDPKEVQEKVFRRQIAIAREMNLPFSVHTREALEDTYRILKDEKISDIGGIMHSFSGDAEWMKKFLDLGLHISFSGVVTFKKALDVQEAAMAVPLERMLVETDAPYLAPVPYRGKRNEPGYTRYVVEKIAELRQLTFEEVAEQTRVNAHRLFRIDK